MVAQTEVPGVFKDIGEGLLDFSNDTFKVALTNTAPASESSNPLTGTNNRLTNITQIAYTNLSGGAAPSLANGAWAILSGEYAYDADDMVLTASGGTLPTFQYVYIYDDTATGDPIVAHLDIGSAVSLADGESRTLQFDADGIFRLGRGTLS
jgi:hypothetical protein